MEEAVSLQIARSRKSGSEVQHVLFLLGHAATCLCTKRLMPSLLTCESTRENRATRGPVRSGGSAALGFMIDARRSTPVPFLHTVQIVGANGTESSNKHFFPTIVAFPTAERYTAREQKALTGSLLRTYGGVSQHWCLD